MIYEVILFSASVRKQAGVVDGKWDIGACKITYMMGLVSKHLMTETTVLGTSWQIMVL